MIHAKLSQLSIYPVKSLQGINLQQAELTEQGLKWDRHWMVVDQNGNFISQRVIAAMATITTEITGSELILSHPKQAPLHIPLYQLPKTERRVKVWRSECLALDEGDIASRWLTNVLGQWRGSDLFMVRMAPEFERQVSDNHTNGATNTTFFADGYPYLVTNTASLAVLNQELEATNQTPVPMSRFRTNIAIESDTAFAEHQFLYLQFYGSNVKLQLCKPCQRCKMTSIDQTNANVRSPQQPLATLSAMTHIDQPGGYFGHNAVLEAHSKRNLPTVIKLGDQVCFRD